MPRTWWIQTESFLQNGFAVAQVLVIVRRHRAVPNHFTDLIQHLLLNFRMLRQQKEGPRQQNRRRFAAGKRQQPDVVHQLLLGQFRSVFLHTTKTLPQDSWRQPSPRPNQHSPHGNRENVRAGRLDVFWLRAPLCDQVSHEL